LDGTLLDSGSRLGERDRATLERLGAQGVIRVVATGRSLYSARSALDVAFPIDYLVFSTGAGIMDWRSGELIRCRHLDRDQARQAVAAVQALRCDFMLHGEIPDNHRFYFHDSKRRTNPDFHARIARYRDFARDWVAGLPGDGPVSQLLVVEPPAESPHELLGEPGNFDRLRAGLSDFTVIRTTSPLDHRSRWIEIFPETVSKSRACDWLCRRLGLHPSRVLGVGNDYNDTDLLAWAGCACVVGNGVAPLKARHRVVATNNDAGFSHAVAHWQKTRA